MDESVARDIEMESIQRERRMDDWWFDSDDPLSSGKIKESVEASRHRLVQHATIVEHTDTISQMIIFMAKELTEEEKEQVQRSAGGEGKGESPDGSSAAGIQQVAFPAKSYVANLDEQISTLISLEHRRARAERLLRRNRATGSAGGAGASMLANVSGAGGSNMMLAGQSQMAGRKLLLQAFMMETDDVGGGKGAGGGTADAARAASQASSADDAASVGFSLSTDENPQSALVAAAMRVFFCLLRFGFKDTCRKARNQLSEVTMFRRLANISTGDSRRPMWWDYLLGAKFLAVAQEVLGKDQVGKIIGRSCCLILLTSLTLFFSLLLLLLWRCLCRIRHGHLLRRQRLGDGFVWVGGRSPLWSFDVHDGGFSHPRRLLRGAAHVGHSDLRRGSQHCEDDLGVRVWRLSAVRHR